MEVGRQLTILSEKKDRFLENLISTIGTHTIFIIFDVELFFIGVAAGDGVSIWRLIFGLALMVLSVAMFYAGAKSLVERIRAETSIFWNCVVVAFQRKESEKQED